MLVEELREYCLLKAGVSEDTPFGPDTLVFRVKNKIFALTGLDSPIPTVNLKCDPAYAIELREQHEGIKPGYHMNKKHWNTLEMNSVPLDLLKKLIDHSYLLVAESLPIRVQEDLKLIGKK